MGFAVEPSEVRLLGTRLDTIAAASTSAVGYAEHTKPNAAGLSAMVRLIEVIADVKPAIIDFFRHLESVGSASADELIAAANLYEHTDGATASELASIRTGGC